MLWYYSKFHTLYQKNLYMTTPGAEGAVAAARTAAAAGDGAAFAPVDSPSAGAGPMRGSDATARRRGADARGNPPVEPFFFAFGFWIAVPTHTIPVAVHVREWVREAGD